LRVAGKLGAEFADVRRVDEHAENSESQRV
jgi:hypothetical protein